MKIPSDNRWIQLNKGDILGVLNETHNITFDKEGIVKLNHKSVVHSNDITGDGGATDFEQVQGIEMYDGDIYAITDDDVFKGDLDGTFLAATTIDLDVATESVVVYGRLYVVDSGSVDYYNGTSWTSGVITGLSTTSGVKHPMASFDSLTDDKLAIGDNNTVKIYDSAHVAGQTLTLPAQYIVTTLAYRSGYLYVGTKTDDGGEARVFIWDGSGGNANISVPVGASWVLSLIPYKGTVAGITNEGELFTISGTAKQHLAGLPIFYTPHKRWFSAIASTNSVVLSSGMDAIGDVIYLAVEGTIANSLTQYGMKDGVWVYDPEVGLYHYATPTVDPVVSDGSFTLSANEFTTSANHNLITGDPVSFTNTSNLTGVNTDILYYAIVSGLNTFKLAANRYDADLGNELTVTGTPSGDTVIYAQNTDRGAILGGTTGAVKSTNHRTVVEPIFSTDIIYGYEVRNLSQTIESTIQAFCDSYSVGWFATQKIYAGNVKQVWQDVVVFLNGCHFSNEKVVVKYRAQDSPTLPSDEVSVTWSNTTQFSTSDLKLKNNINVGDEVIFTRGQGQGQTAHITAITVAATTTTITVDESLGSASATARVIVTNYKKAGTITSTREDGDFSKVSLGSVKSTWIQLKIELRGFGIEVPMLELHHSQDV